jgi:glycine cleavage system H lipoate-binding protein/ABC-type phosphate transport system substrate-binding protein
MKTKILIIIAFLIIGLSNVDNQKAFASKCQNLPDTITIVSSPELYGITTSWVNEYSKLNQGAKIKVLEIADNHPELKPNDKGGIYFLTDDISLNSNQATWKMVVGVNAIVPVVSANCPFLDELNNKGITSEKFALIFKNKKDRNWGTILNNGSANLVTLLTVNGESNKSQLANFLRVEPSLILSNSFEKPEEMIAAINKDPNAVGFCKISDIVNPATNEINSGIKILPIDKNGNGKMDSNEKIYADLATFLRGVWVGKYPRELNLNIYSVSASAPTDENTIAFLSWVMTDGQQLLNKSGFSNLAFNQRQSNLSRLKSNEAVVEQSKGYPVIPIVAGVIVLCLVLFFGMDYLSQRLRKGKVLPINVTSTSSFINENSLEVLDGLYFDKSHTWAFLEKNGVVSIGIDDFLQHVTGPITRIKMKNSGEEVKKGETFLTIIQEGKQLNINAPISGKIKAQNEKLLSNSSILNTSPYSDGWIYKIEPTNWLRDTQFLIFAQGYREWIRLEFLHLKDFLAVVLRANYGENAQVVLQDGGEIRDGVLKELGPEVWEDFQTHFLENSI